ncbi:MAG TPA: hypothetical protein VL086_13535 [Candidatus Nitrosotalea sp.]|nr:hypothetical protein [Candidatus Nitrosotalea sp.]
MTTRPDLPSIIAAATGPRDLRLRNDLREPGWMFRELRTLNRHRVVGLVTPYRQFESARDLEAEIRGVVARHFKASWWRGMAYGVVAEVAELSLGADDLKTLVDVRENSRGDLQWVILVASQASGVVGVHTWIEAYLSPVYRDIVQALAATGRAVATATREKDGMMKFLTGVADLNAALRSLGTRTEAFPEFRDRP